MRPAASATVSGRTHWRRVASSRGVVWKIDGEARSCSPRTPTPGPRRVVSGAAGAVLTGAGRSPVRAPLERPRQRCARGAGGRDLPAPNWFRWATLAIAGLVWVTPVVYRDLLRHAGNPCRCQWLDASPVAAESCEHFGSSPRLGHHELVITSASWKAFATPKQNANSGTVAAPPLTSNAGADSCWACCGTDCRA